MKLELKDQMSNIQRMFFALSFLGLLTFPKFAYSNAPSDRNLSGYFISIDGLQSPLLESFVRSASARPGGFKSFWNEGAVFPKTSAHLISITAASHASTSTCVSPAKHGIIGNHFLRDHKHVSGFQLPYNTKTMWEVARKQKRKIVSFAYAGVDGSTPARTVDAGITYPDESKMGSPQIVALKEEGTIPLTIEIPLLSGTKRQLTLELVRKGTAKTNVTHQKTFRTEIIWKDLDNKSHRSTFTANSAGMNFANLIFSDSERMRRISIFEVDAKIGKFWVSRASYNAAFPDSFRKTLDEELAVWPDVNIKKADLGMTPIETVEFLATLDDFIAAAAVKTIPQLNPDIVLLYQPLIDSTGHSFQNSLPDRHSLARRDPVTRAFRSAYAHVDSNLAKIFSGTNKDDVIAAMGDHGMAATLANVNVASLISKEVDSYFDVYASDAMLFLYPKSESKDPATIKRLGLQVQAAIEKLAWRGKNVIETAMEKASVDTTRWPYGDAAWAFRTKPGFWLTNNSLNREIFLPAKVPGIHGHNPSDPAMLTTLLLKGRGVTKGVFRKKVASLVQAVPTFAKLLNLKTPVDCEGSPLF